MKSCRGGVGAGRALDERFARRFFRVRTPVREALRQLRGKRPGRWRARIVVRWWRGRTGPA